MIEYVTRDKATWAEVPHKFEAGTVSAGDAVGMAAAIRYIQSVGLENIQQHDAALACRIIDGMKNIPHINIIGPKDGNKRC
jgi:cysteine desulfurase/selenocysteine lyase